LDLNLGGKMPIIDANIILLTNCSMNASTIVIFGKFVWTCWTLISIRNYFTPLVVIFQIVITLENIKVIVILYRSSSVLRSLLVSVIVLLKIL